MQAEGKIEFLNEKGFGFLKVDGYDKQVFFHARDLRGIRFEQLRPGDIVTVQSISFDEKGYKAQEVTLNS